MDTKISQTIENFIEMKFFRSKTIIEGLKNMVGTIFIVLGAGVIIVSILFLMVTKEILYLSLLANGATLVGLGIVINASAETREKITAKKFEMRDYATAVWDFFDPRFLINGMSTYHTTGYGDQKKYIEVAVDARRFLLGNVKEMVKEAIREMEIMVEPKGKGKFIINFKEKTFKHGKQKPNNK